MTLDELRAQLEQAKELQTVIHDEMVNATDSNDEFVSSLKLLKVNKDILRMNRAIEQMEIEIAVNSDETQKTMTEAMKDYTPTMLPVRFVNPLSLDDYQRKAKATDLYPPAVRFFALLDGLAEETGEVLGKHKKHLRGDEAYKTEEQLKTALIKEIGDVLWYVAMLADEMGVPLSEIAQANLDKLASRQERDVIKGDGDGR